MLSVIYMPTQRFAFSRFKRTTDEVEIEFYRYISERNSDLLGSQELIVTARNQISTVADRSGAGLVESGGKDDYRIVAVAKQDGLGGIKYFRTFEVIFAKSEKSDFKFENSENFKLEINFFLSFYNKNLECSKISRIYFF